MHEAIQQYLRKRGINFLAKDGPRAWPHDRVRRREFTKRQCRTSISSPPTSAGLLQRSNRH